MSLFGGEKNTEEHRRTTNNQRTDPESARSTKERKGREETRTNSSIGNFLETKRMFEVTQGDYFLKTKRVTKLVTQSETPVKTGCRTGLKK